MSGGTVGVLVVDDEPAARRGLRRAVEAEPGFEVVGECADGSTAVSVILERRPDVVLLDIQMPEMDGLRVVEAVGVDRMPAFVFVTAYDQHTLRAFDLHALDYVLKPYDPARLRAALQRARDRVLAGEPREGERLLRALLEARGPAASFLERVAVWSGSRVVFVDAADIDWIEAADHALRIHAAGREYAVRETLGGFEAKLDPAVFLRVHRSRIVNVRRISELHPMFHGEYVLVLRDGTQVGTGRSYKERIQALVANVPGRPPPP